MDQQANEKLFLMKNVDASDCVYDDSAVRADSISFYAEYRRSTTLKSDLYGGDGYPMVWTTELENGKKAGMILVSDGLGTGSFIHGHLEEKYTAESWKEDCETNGKSDSDVEAEKLYDFLLNLYGEEFFTDEDAVKYALRSFAPRQPDSIYMTSSGEPRFDESFYCRSSQYLASRIVLVGVFYKCRKWIRELGNNWSAKSVSEFRAKVQAYVDGLTDEEGNLYYRKVDEHGNLYGDRIPVNAANCHSWIADPDAPDCLRKNVWKTFDIGSDPDANKRVYLPCTLACWVYVEGEDDHVDAAALYLGDSRCYKIDLTDGVKQISVDDVSANAAHDGAMTVLQTFGFNHNVRTTERNGVSVLMHDGAIKATMVKLTKPCAVFCCSDGVYDTCPVFDERIEGMQQRKPADSIGEFEMYREVNDLAFEYNFLSVLRKCDSLDDIRQMISRTFYGHAIASEVSERGSRSPVSTFISEEQSGGVKLDDSATFGIKFFSTKAGFPELISELRKRTDTTLDLVWKEFSDDRTKEKYCASLADSDYSFANKEARIDAEVVKLIGEDFVNILVKNAMEYFSEVKTKKQLYGLPCRILVKKEGAFVEFVRRNLNNLLTVATSEFESICRINFSQEAEAEDDPYGELLKKREQLREYLHGGSDSEDESEFDEKCGRAGEYCGKISALFSEVSNLLARMGNTEAELDEADISELKKMTAIIKNELGENIVIGKLESLTKAAEELKKREYERSAAAKDAYACFPVVADYYRKLLDGEDKEKVEAWLNDENALTLGYNDENNVLNHIICNDGTFVALNDLAKRHGGRGLCFSETFKNLIGEEKRKEIFESFEDRAEFESYENASRAHEAYEELIADEVEAAGDGDLSFYGTVMVDNGRKYGKK